MSTNIVLSKNAFNFIEWFILGGGLSIVRFFKKYLMNRVPPLLTFKNVY